MFDDLKKDQNQSSGQVPKKLDDMFADVDPTSQVNQSPVARAASFEEKPSALRSGKMQPISPNQGLPLATAEASQQSEQMAPALPADLVSQDIPEGQSPKQKIIIVLSVFFLLLLAGGAFYYFVFRSDFLPEGGGLPIEQPPVNGQNGNGDEPPIDVDPIIDIGDDRFLDSDLDGLSDAEERALGTNPYDPDTDNDGVLDYDEVRVYRTNPLLADTDGDGLTDYEEIFIYGTDPNNPDTDRDGYSDGVEVENDYNPLGPGLLDEMPAMPIPLPASFWEQVPDDFFFRPMQHIEEALGRYQSTGRLY
ncbi:MAG: hypothetical protein PHO91_00490 [Patescibacteria group bacterium]|nr:hypothetical protein [Patescibacteria group bacterium]